MGRKPKYSKETKIKVCKEYEKGNRSFSSIAKLLEAEKSTVRQWYLRYKEHGPSAFETLDKNRFYSKNFKTSVIEEYNSGEYSMPDLAAKYNIAYSVVRNWIDKWYNGLEIKDYDPKGDVYTMKARKTTFEERLENDESKLTEVEKLKLKLEKEKALRKRREFELEVLKKKEEFEKKIRYQK